MKKMTEAQFRKRNTKRRRELAERLANARITIGLSQLQLAEMAGIDRKTVNRIENNHFSPSIDTFLRLCHVLRVNPSMVIGKSK